MLYGRDAETAEIDRLIEDARDGRSGLLVVRGEAGIGKTALLEYAAGAAGVRVLRATGVEYESGMPYAALHMLLGRHLDGVGALPDAQAAALRAALGMGGAPGDGDRFLVGLAVLTLLADLAEDGPLVVLVDDVQWLDGPSAEALLFAARRLRAEPIAVLLAAREPGGFRAEGLPELRLGGLDEDAAARLLAGRSAELPRHVRHEVLTAAMGNPLALLELPGTEGGSSAYERIRRSFAAQLAGLPEPSRLFVLLVAADDLGDAGVVTAAAGRLGASLADLEPAERAGLLRGRRTDAWRCGTRWCGRRRTGTSRWRAGSRRTGRSRRCTGSAATRATGRSISGGR
ncbi:AAA family ATPase [Actinomadura sp. WMMB 499]|uniref:AAA family ATPase n=1 Tax=Actinomadura sp. WMMB 499 TaxID=1219491 RepID=UPI0020C74D74|nr:ATP-binding protein [Actinomadura sp. WMMB 499]